MDEATMATMLTRPLSVVGIAYIADFPQLGSSCTTPQRSLHSQLVSSCSHNRVKLITLANLRWGISYQRLEPARRGPLSVWRTTCSPPLAKRALGHGFRVCSRQPDRVAFLNPHYEAHGSEFR